MNSETKQAQDRTFELSKKREVLQQQDWAEEQKQRFSDNFIESKLKVSAFDLGTKVQDINNERSKSRAEESKVTENCHEGSKMQNTAQNQISSKGKIFVAKNPKKVVQINPESNLQSAQSLKKRSLEQQTQAYL